MGNCFSSGNLAFNNNLRSLIWEQMEFEGKLYTEAILREFEGFFLSIIVRPNLNNIRFADDTVLIADADTKIQEAPQKLVKESKKNVQNINCKKSAK